MNGEAPIHYAKAAVAVPGSADLILKSVEIIVAGYERFVDQPRTIARGDLPPAGASPFLAVEIADCNGSHALGLVADGERSSRRGDEKEAGQHRSTKNQWGSKSAHP